MEKEKSRQKQLHKKKCRAIIGFVTSFVLLCLASGVLIAKYYAGSSNKGVATASSLYFSSNVLRTVGEITENTDYSNFPIIYSSEAWSGNNCIMEVQIRNYQNQLLYNDRNLDIIYNIKFELPEDSDGGTYEVSSDGTNYSSIDPTNGFTFSNVTLNGGTATTDTYKIRVIRPESQANNNNYKSNAIRVTAVPVSPSYVTNSATLGGILYASMVSAQYKLSYGFNKVISIADYSGFPYTITYTPNEDNAAHQIKVIWNEKLEIDQFNKYYVQVKDDNTLCGTTDDSRKYIILTMEPYSSVDIIFYRNGFDDTTDSLVGCVEVVDMTLGGTSSTETNTSETSSEEVANSEGSE